MSSLSKTREILIQDLQISAEKIEKTDHLLTCYQKDKYILSTLTFFESGQSKDIDDFLDLFLPALNRSFAASLMINLEIEPLEMAEKISSEVLDQLLESLDPVECERRRKDVSEDDLLKTADQVIETICGQNTNKVNREEVARCLKSFYLDWDLFSRIHFLGEYRDQHDLTIADEYPRIVAYYIYGLLLERSGDQDSLDPVFSVDKAQKIKKALLAI
ncbi:MAG: hypothetical protein MI743_13380 [Sneathiellales bacterium]|nr:hypothetical protein [Sneathiellales bacterium]